MKILLISANTETMNMPTIPMGLGCVAAALNRAGHRPVLLDLLGEDDPMGAVASALAEIAPDLIGVSLRNIDDQNMQAPRFLLDGAREVVSVCRRGSAAPVVLGGAGYSIFPRACLDYLKADYGIQGEGEQAMAALAGALERGGAPPALPGLFVRGRKSPAGPECIRTLDRYPPPDPSWFPVSRYHGAQMWLPFQTRRGCPLKCSYCSTPTIEGTQIRRRAVDAAVDSLARWAEAGFRRVFFVDNTFNLPASFARDLCSRLCAESLQLSWRAILYPGGLDRALVEAMAAAGCCEVSLGFESGDPAMLTAMNKRFGPDEIRRAAGLLSDAGIRQMGFLLLGGPGETRDSVRRSFSFVEGLNLDMVKVTVGVRIYPETKLAEEARKKGIVASDDDLLFPRFYLEPALADWIVDYVRQEVEKRTGWMF